MPISPRSRLRDHAHTQRPPLIPPPIVAPSFSLDEIAVIFIVLKSFQSRCDHQEWKISTVLDKAVKDWNSVLSKVSKIDLQ